ncbi:hypothetical protein JGUZn3_09980 [Entomobacter blattae]|uniref:Uncharacterized protein n=1 Tax=Entomobacter blattae TaxID=2762277 RepID=A0A7H1NR18_9PROT|nr:hypothetical protein JGUZn3_09980 [Entomobacter blattae]
MHDYSGEHLGKKKGLINCQKNYFDKNRFGKNYPLSIKMILSKTVLAKIAPGSALKKESPQKFPREKPQEKP